MNSIAKTALKDIVAAAVGLLPGGDLLKNTAREAAEDAISSLCKKDRDIFESVLDEITKALKKRPETISPEDPGRALSAARNVVDTVRKSKLDADRLIDCDLDPSRVYEYLLNFPAVGIETASGGRKKIYQSYLRTFAEKVTDAAFSTAPFQRRLHQRILRNQRIIIESIERNKEGLPLKSDKDAAD
jgi:hypothetical protein